MDPDLWNIFHDGSIETIVGSVPGIVRLSVAIVYLREMLPGEGTGFKVVLSGCTEFSHAEFDRPSITDLSAIAALEPEILSAESSSPLKITCGTGTLTLQYQTASVYLDSGAPVTMEELGAACNAYWDAWSKRARADS